MSTRAFLFSLQHLHGVNLSLVHLRKLSILWAHLSTRYLGPLLYVHAIFPQFLSSQISLDHLQDPDNHDLFCLGCGS